MAKEKNSINTEKNLPVATFSKEISKDFFSEKEEHYYFHLKYTVHEFAMGLKEILLCVHFAEDEGLIPKASYEWWSFLYSTYNVPHEPYSQNYKEGFHNGFWNAIELINFVMLKSCFMAITRKRDESDNLDEKITFGITNSEKVPANWIYKRKHQIDELYFQNLCKYTEYRNQKLLERAKQIMTEI